MWVRWQKLEAKSEKRELRLEAEKIELRNSFVELQAENAALEAECRNLRPHEETARENEILRKAVAEGKLARQADAAQHEAQIAKLSAKLCAQPQHDPLPRPVAVPWWQAWAATLIVAALIFGVVLATLFAPPSASVGEWHSESHLASCRSELQTTREHLTKEQKWATLHEQAQETIGLKTKQLSELDRQLTEWVQKHSKLADDHAKHTVSTNGCIDAQEQLRSRLKTATDRLQVHEARTIELEEAQRECAAKLVASEMRVCPNSHQDAEPPPPLFNVPRSGATLISVMGADFASGNRKPQTAAELHALYIATQLELNSTKEELRSKHALLGQSDEHLKAAVSEKATLELRVKELTSASSAIELEARKQTAALENELSRSKADVDANTAELAAKDAELKTLSESRAALVTELAATRADRNESAAALELLTEKLKSAADERGRLQEQLAALLSAKQAAESGLTAAHDAIELELNRTKSALEEEARMKANAVEELAAGTKHLQSSLEELVQNRSEELARLNTRLAEFAADFEQSRVQVGELQVEKETLNAANADLTKRLSDAEGQKLALTESVEFLQRELDEHRQGQESAAATTDVATKQLRERIGELESALETEERRATEEATQLKTALQALQAANDNQQEQLTTQKELIVREKEIALAQMESKAADLQSQMSRIEHELEASNLLLKTKLAEAEAAVVSATAARDAAEEQLRQSSDEQGRLHSDSETSMAATINDLQARLEEAGERLRAEVAAQAETAAQLQQSQQRASDLDANTAVLASMIADVREQLKQASEAKALLEGQVARLVDGTVADSSVVLRGSSEGSPVQLLESRLVQLRSDNHAMEAALLGMSERLNRTSLELEETFAGIERAVQDAREKAVGEAKLAFAAELRESTAELEAQLVLARDAAAASTTKLAETEAALGAETAKALEAVAQLELVSKELIAKESALGAQQLEHDAALLEAKRLFSADTERARADHAAMEEELASIRAKLALHEQQLDRSDAEAQRDAALAKDAARLSEALERSSGREAELGAQVATRCNAAQRAAVAPRRTGAWLYTAGQSGRCRSGLS